MTSQHPPGASTPNTLKPRTFRIILAAVFFVGSMLPVLRGCNTSWNSFEVVLILTGRFPENILGWLLIGSLLFIVSMITIALYTFSNNEAKRPLFGKAWSMTLTAYVLVVLAFVLQNPRMFEIGFGWIVLTLLSIVGLLPSFFMKLLRVQTGTELAEGQSEFPLSPFHTPQSHNAAPPPVIPPAPTVPQVPFPPPPPTSVPIPPPPPTAGS